MSRPALVQHLGRVPYREAWDLQAQLQEELILAKREARPVLPPHRILVVEHPPVFTLGKNGSVQNLLASPERLERAGAAYVETDRGGDITFHGPGQVVVYPVLDLNRLETPDGQSLRDLHRYMRSLEEAVIGTCAGYGINARRISGRTGVWVGPDARGPERKICAMGVRVSRWVTMHGLAFNVTTDLRWFDMIIPCGISDRSVTSLERELGTAPQHQEVAESLVDRLAEQMGLSLRVTEGDEPIPAGLPDSGRMLRVRSH